ncbi:hypothetical protein ROZALSC1DRAFT_25657 [Rozella allomycis CSF55]|uniref:Uncharacterized protein n=1 Tax=Rozella allomycis (strain CSF55) TaxID=988480 RepID=A0A4P9YAY2_ROZAC|nr:hypothetical protein ROZALSC1DRAFT_25657 [Rozella allomycis CSF55]
MSVESMDRAGRRKVSERFREFCYAHVVEPRGILDENGRLFIALCSTCKRSFDSTAKRIGLKHLALVNGSFIGEIPSCIRDLTCIKKCDTKRFSRQFHGYSARGNSTQSNFYRSRPLKVRWEQVREALKWLLVNNVKMDASRSAHWKPCYGKENDITEDFKSAMEAYAAHQVPQNEGIQLYKLSPI